MSRLTCLDVDQFLHHHDHTCYEDDAPPEQPTTPPKPAPAAKIERCDLTDLPTNTCAHCLGHRSPNEEIAAARATLAARPRPWTPAQYPGTCAACRHPYGPGTPIQRDPDYGWVSQCCGDPL